MSRGKKPPKKATPARRLPGRATASMPRLEPPSQPQAFPLKSRVPGRSQPQEGRYVYGVIESSTPLTFGKSSIGGVKEDVYTVHHGRLAAVVSRTLVSIFDPTPENALAHEHVVETVMKNCTILPMSFGIVLGSDNVVREMLKSVYAPLQDALHQMAGKLEFGLKVTWDRDRMVEELRSEHEEIRRLHQELARKGLQFTYFARMQLNRMVEKALSGLAAGYVRDIHRGLQSVSVASRDNKPIGEKMILNAAFLVPKEREAAFSAAVNRVAHKFGHRLNFKLTGPWPPYNFVNIHLRLEKGKAG